MAPCHDRPCDSAMRLLVQVKAGKLYPKACAFKDHGLPATVLKTLSIAAAERSCRLFEAILAIATS